MRGRKFKNMERKIKPFMEEGVAGGLHRYLLAERIIELDDLMSLLELEEERDRQTIFLN